MNFHTFKTAVAAQFQRMSQHTLFRTSVEKDDLWTTYLNSFPVGSNPIYKERTEHDCNCCKSFIRAVGNVVAIIDNQVVSLWDCTVPNEPAYQAVADALSELVKSQPVDNLFLHYDRTAGVDKNLQDTLDGVVTWQHFFVNLPPALVVQGDSIATRLGDKRATRDVMYRSLCEISDEAIDTVLELISQNSLYRGEEHRFAVDGFKKLKGQFKAAPNADLFVWAKLDTFPASVSRIRNTAIGTLLVDLSEGMELELAVKSFESKVAPTNYKRPTALVTKAMIEAAKRDITELGLTSALERRYATVADITVNNVLFANRDTRKSMNGSVFDTLSDGVSEQPKNFDRVEDVPIDKFLADILPSAKSIELLVENRHAGNFVSLIAPVDPTAAKLFKWGNNFSWSYSGDVADSIKERVKQAGGNVTGELCCRLAWDYDDDLDFHMLEPNKGHIYYANRRQLSRCGGMLDVDANGADGIRKNPCENIFYERLSTMAEGVYELKVNNFRRRYSGAGFEVEIDIQGAIHRMEYKKVLRTDDTVQVATLRYTKAKGIEIVNSLPSSQSSRVVWNVPTQSFRPVNVMMLSPNHWDGAGVGNRHYFFMLDSCCNDGTARGFYNEFLKAELDPHRKVIEMVGAKLRTAESQDQLSGLGFSSTQRNDVLCRVKGSFTRVIKLTF